MILQSSAQVCHGFIRMTSDSTEHPRWFPCHWKHTIVVVVKCAPPFTEWLQCLMSPFQVHQSAATARFFKTNYVRVLTFICLVSFPVNPWTGWAGQIHVRSSKCCDSQQLDKLYTRYSLIHSVKFRLMLIKSCEKEATNYLMQLTE